MEHATKADRGTSDGIRDAARPAGAVLDHLVALRALGWRHAMALKDGRNQVALLERETARSRSAMEQFLAVTLAALDQARAALRVSEADRVASANHLRIQTDRNSRLTTRWVVLAAALRAKESESEDARRERSAKLSDGHFQIRTLTARIGELEARDRDGRDRAARAEDALRRQAETEAALAAALRRQTEAALAAALRRQTETEAALAAALRRQTETEAALAAALRREEDLRSRCTRSRWIALGRALGLTKL